MDRQQQKIANQFGEGSNWSVVGKPIKRAVFYFPDGTSHELLADAYHLQRYLSRGFTLEPPKKPIPETDGETSVAPKTPRRKRRSKVKRKEK